MARQLIVTTEGIVLMGVMLCYAGLGFAIPAGLPLALEIYERHGLSQKQVAGVTSAWHVLYGDSALTAASTT